MRIGELAQATGISVRTLHHYDEVGLLKPTARSEAGHRIYTEADVARLHKVVSLKSVGFTLEEIGQFVGHSQEELRDLASRQLEKIETEIEELERRKWCLSAVTEAHQWDQYKETETLLNLIRELTIQSQYFSAEERKAIQARNDSIGLERTKRMHIKLSDLTKTAQEFMDSKISPTDPRVISLANEWNALGNEGVGDNPEIKEKIKRMLKENPDLASYRGITPSLLEYLRTAFRSQMPE